MRFRRYRDAKAAFWFLAPAFCLLALVRLFPVVEAVIASLKHGNLHVTLPATWVGLKNYDYLLTQSPSFLPAVGYTFLFVALVVIVQTVLSLAVAVLMTQNIPLVKLWRTLIFVPIAIPITVSTVLWQIALGNGGIVDAFFHALGLGSPPFFTSPTMVYVSFIVILTWIGLGFWMMMLVAAIQDVPGELRQAAAVDGASTLRAFFSVVLPLLRRPLAFIIVALTVTNSFVFAPSQIITDGGPNGVTHFLLYDIYEQAFQNGNTQLASAEVVLFTLIILVVVAVQYKLIAPKEDIKW